MSNCTWYLLNLSPLETYFFGGETTFGEGEGKNYAVRTNPYPQQTSLLGLLRHVLLMQNEALPLADHKAKANALIGAKSFDIGQPNVTQTFGAICKVGPLLLRKEGAWYRFAHGLDDKVVTFTPAGHSAGANGQVANEVVHLADYDPKTQYPPRLREVVSGKVLPFEEVFLTQEQVGIQKMGGDDAFYRQTYGRLAEGFCFACWVCLANNYAAEGNPPVKFADQVISFGGEQKPFWLKIEATQTTKPEIATQTTKPDPIVASSPEGRRITLLSDAYVPNAIYAHCAFALSDLQDFRTVAMGHWGQQFIRQPTKLNLLRRGSVLFAQPGKAKMVTDLLEQPKNFRQIGFNQYFQTEIKHLNSSTEI
jgi:CRISPR-associated protein Cmr3